MKAAPLALALALATSGFAAAPVAAQVPGADAVFAATTLNVSASGETRIAPDQAVINLGVTSRALTAREAMRLNNVAMNQVVAALRKEGVAEKDVQTSGLNLNPQMVYRENQPPRVTGYEASNIVTVTVNDLGKLGPTVDAVVAAGSNQINGISFGLRDPRAAEDAAREGGALRCGHGTPGAPTGQPFRGRRLRPPPADADGAHGGRSSHGGVHQRVARRAAGPGGRERHL